MKTVVFGGAGFLGSHVADALTEAKYEVTIFDRKSSPYIKKSQEMLTGDILDESLVKKVVSGKDIVFNFAGISSIDECADKPVETVKHNVLGNVIILEAAVEAKIKRFVFASSAYVYSNVGAFYKNAKQASELFIETYGKDKGLDYTIVRYGSLYGPRADENNSIYKIIKQAISNGRIDYHGTGEEIREYIHVKDAARLTVEILKEEYKNQHIVLTGNQSMKYSQLLNMIKEMLNNKVVLKYLPNISETHYAVTPYSFSPKLGKKLTSNPYIDMGQGLLEIMEDVYKEQNKEKHQELGFWISNE